MWYQVPWRYNKKLKSLNFDDAINSVLKVFYLLTRLPNKEDLQAWLGAVWQGAQEPPQVLAHSGHGRGVGVHTTRRGHTLADVVTE